MENISQVNIRILIGQELGEIYLIMQQYINNKWQHHPDHKYRGGYFVNKKIKELLKYNIQNIRKGSKNDLVKFKIADNICVYINDYSVVKDYPELSDLNKVLTKKIICKKLSSKMILVQNKRNQLLTNDIMKAVLVSALSLGTIGVINSLKIEHDERKSFDELKSIVQFSDDLEVDIISNVNKDNKNVSSVPKDMNNVRIIKVFSDILNEINLEYKNYYSSVKEDSSLENDIMNESVIIQKYADMYFMDYNKASKIYFDNYEEIISSDNLELTFLLKIKDAFYADESIDKQPIITDMTSEEKEKYIIAIAKDVYKIDDEETYALLLAIHRIEAYNGNSRRCVEDNNPGGLKENGKFLKFKTFEIGAECFVRNVQKIINQTKNMPNYNYDVSFEDNMQEIYCKGDNAWGVEVKSIKDSILENNELDIYLGKDNINDKKYLKGK